MTPRCASSHSAAHMLAAAVLELYPGTKLAIGPTVENGFYYDFKFPEGVSVSENDIEKIEEKMKSVLSSLLEDERNELLSDIKFNKALKEKEKKFFHLKK